MEMCYIHILRSDFAIIYMFLKERRTKYKQAWALVLAPHVQGETIV